MAAVPFGQIAAVCKAKISLDEEAIARGRRGALAEVTIAAKQQEEQQSGQRLPLIDPVDDLKFNDMEFVERWTQRKNEAALASQSKCAGCPKLDEHYAIVARGHQLRNDIVHYETLISMDNLRLFPDLEARMRVLVKLNYIDSNANIMIKGRIAREINSCDELIATELILDNVLTNLSPGEAVSLLSLLVFEQKNSVAPKLTENLDKAKKAVEAIALRLAEVQIECGLDITVKEYLKGLKPGLMEVCYEWSKGMAFAEIMNLTDVLEGSIVRNLKRLDETLGEFRNAARIIGDSLLFEQMENASILIKRDIIFSSSLYLSGAPLPNSQ